MALKIQIVNASGHTAYLNFGGNTGSLQGSYQGSPLGAATKVQVASGFTQTGLSINQFVSGKFLISLDKPLSSSEPQFQSGSGGDSATRFDKVELTEDGTPSASANLSSTDFFGLALGIQTYDSSGKLKAFSGWNIDTTIAFEKLAAFSGNNASAVVTGAAGDPVSGVGNVLRVIAPSTVPPAVINSYPSFAAYIANIQARAVVTNVVGHYNGVGNPQGAGQQAQSYNYSMTIDSSGAMVLTGTNSLAPSTQHTIRVAGADLSAALYSTNPAYTVDGNATSPYTDPNTGVKQPYAIGNNDVFATAIRDALSGFDFGFVGSTAIDPLTGVALGSEASDKWYLPSPTRFQNAFGYAQSNPQFYNQYAAVIASNSGSYGFPFTDLIGHPLVNIGPDQADTLSIFIGPDSADRLFNSTYYNTSYASAVPAGYQAYTQYMTAGWKQGLNPSPYFQTSYYLQNNPDVAAAGVNPLVHFEQSGDHEGRKPNPYFDPNYYIQQNPSAGNPAVDPLTDYLTTGWTKGYNPSSLFNDAAYLAANPDVKAAGIDPLLHYLASGQSEGRSAIPVVSLPGVDAAYYIATYNLPAGTNASNDYYTTGWTKGYNPSAAFDGNAYLTANPDVKAAGLNPLSHYLQFGRTEGRAAIPVGLASGVDATYYNATYNLPAGTSASGDYYGTGWRSGRNPNAFFDTKYYLQHNPDVKAVGIDPVAHFLSSGWKEGREPSLVFSDAKYLAAYPDVKNAGVDPLLHYLTYGANEGRMTFLTGGTQAADVLVDPAYYDPQLGATLIPTGEAASQQAAWSYDTTGWQNGLNPDQLFDTNYYLTNNPDVRAAGVNPLKHYEQFGFKEGRDPSASFSTSKYLAAYADARTAAASGLDPLTFYTTTGKNGGEVPQPVQSLSTNVLKFFNQPGGSLADSKIYVTIFGQTYQQNSSVPDPNSFVWVDAAGQNHLISYADVSAPNHLTKNGINYANMSFTLQDASQLPMPQLAGGRIYISYNQPLYVIINPDSTKANPSSTVQSNPAYDERWDYYEFAYYPAGGVAFGGDVNQTDQFSIPITSRLQQAAGSYDTTRGSLSFSSQQLVSDFIAETPTAFHDSILNAADGSFLRIISPLQQTPASLQHYFDGVINEFWTKYTATAFVRAKDAIGDPRIDGHVDTTTDKFVFSVTKDDGTIKNFETARPTTDQVFAANGVLAPLGGDPDQSAFLRDLGAALNRGVAATPDDWLNVSAYYPASIAHNYYAEFWHKHSIDGKAYGMSYDDVNNQSSVQILPNNGKLIDQLTLTLGS